MTQPTILIVDDEAGVRELLADALAMSGYTTVEAADGIEALTILHRQTVDLLLIDINMPKMDGFGFIEAVRQDAQYRAIPILVLTTESDDEKKLRARRAGATGWIVKPFDPAKLIAAVRRVAA